MDHNASKEKAGAAASDWDGMASPKADGEGGLHFLKKDKAALQMNARFRLRILMLLALVILISFISNLYVSRQWGNEKLRSKAGAYNVVLTEWIGEQKGILDMFCSVISANPDILKDYEGTVAFLDRITRQYPEISATYMGNPGWDPKVYMNNGWLPPEGWLVEERPWYIASMASESGWSISAPYYDDQTGLYCVTFAERVYDSEDGEFLGVFGIDFFLDKLIDILGGSYTDQEYAFLVDPNGVIINHPNRSYQMTEKNAVNLSQLNYGRLEADGSRSILIRDYDGALRVLASCRNEQSGFSVYEAVSFFDVYMALVISEIVSIAMLIICAVMMYRVLSSLMNWQDSMNARMKEAADSAIAAGQAKSRFLAQMSHEIRTPINAVLGMNEMILRESRDEKILEYASDIRVAGRTLLALINGILDFSKIEEGKMKIIPVEYDTASLINNLVASVSERARTKGLKLTVTADEKLPSRLYGDDVRLSQVVMNLLTNAVKYTEEGEVRFSISEGRREDKRVELKIAVKDTGIGIRKEDLSRLCESFERLDEVRNRNIEGTGLGMPIVTRLLEMMDSHLEVESVYRQGSTFSFAIWQQIADDEPIGNYSGRLEGSGRTGNEETLSAAGARILIADDNEMNLKVAKNLLKLFDIVPDLASSGPEAIARVRKKDYHIIFLDHMMPGMDGVETLAELRRQHLLKDSCVVTALTANAVNGARDQYLSAGFTDYLSKPLDVHKLEAHLLRHLPAEICRSRADHNRTYAATDLSSGICRRGAADQEGRSLAHEPAVPQMVPTEDGVLRQLKSLGYDTEAGLRYAAGDKAFYLELLKDFVRSAGRSAQTIRHLYEENEIRDYQIQVHALKSTARQIGANSLADLALIQETAAREGDLEVIRADAETLLAFLRATEQELGQILGAEWEDKEEKPALPAETVRAEEALGVLETAAAAIDNFEAERAADVLRPLEGLACGDILLSVFISEILEALAEFDIDKAAEKMSSLIKKVADREDLEHG